MRIQQVLMDTLQVFTCGDFYIKFQILSLKMGLIVEGAEVEEEEKFLADEADKWDKNQYKEQ